jgi:hypothetical protein
MEGTMTTTPRLSKSWTQVNSSLGLQADDQIAPLADGGYVVVWTDINSRTHNPAGAAIVAQRYDSLGNKVGGEVNISLFSSGDQFSPAITPCPTEISRSRSSISSPATRTFMCASLIPR